MKMEPGSRKTIFTSLTVVRTCQPQMPAYESGKSRKITCLKVSDPRQRRKNENDHFAETDTVITPLKKENVTNMSTPITLGWEGDSF